MRAKAAKDDDADCDEKRKMEKLSMPRFITSRNLKSNAALFTFCHSYNYAKLTSKAIKLYIQANILCIHTDVVKPGKYVSNLRDKPHFSSLIFANF